MLSPVRLARPATSPAAEAPGRGWRLSGLGKHFDGVPALLDLTLTVAPGEVVAVTGPSGAGKSTLGRLISGLETPSAGEIWSGAQRIDRLPARARRVAHMFESFALYPTRTVAQNVMSPLRAPAAAGGFDAAERARRVAEVLALTEMDRFAERLPSQLSGGQKQRVALCRALVQDPSIFVLDEPIGHLDARLRHHLRGAIRRRQGRQRAGTLWLTPDGIEAMAVADRLAVLIGGRLQQLDAPEAVFARPATVAVARLLGDPAMNVLPATLRPGDAPALVVAAAPAAAVSPAFHARFAPRSRDGRLQLGLRPAELELRPAAAPAAEGREALQGQVYAVEPLGKHTLVSVEVGGQRLRVKAGPSVDWRLGEPVQVAFASDRVLCFDADTGLLQT